MENLGLSDKYAEYFIKTDFTKKAVYITDKSQAKMKD